MRHQPSDSRSYVFREKIWDHCAGVIITEEAGGIVSDASGKPLDFSRGRWLDLDGNGIVAAPPALHVKVIEAIAAERRRIGVTV